MITSMSISQAAAQIGMSVDSIRFYERSGVLAPAPRSAGGRRLYGPAELLELTFIARLRATRMPLSSITRYLALARQGEATLVERAAIMAGHRDKVAAQIADLQHTLEILDFKIAHAAEIERSGRCGVSAGLGDRSSRAMPARPALKIVSGA
jgi:DNA-binding transcriptional MerR regulator